MTDLIEIYIGEPTENFDDPNFISSFKWDNFQINSFINIKKNKNILVVAPTSSGKTAVAKYGIINTVKNMKKRVMYSSPIKSLSNEKFNEFRNMLSKEDISVGLLTGDNKINIDSDVLVVTTEIIRNYLVKLTENNYELITDSIMDSIGCVIMDEIHFINDPKRGKIWEDVIILLKQDIQLIMLSATIDKPVNFASWITSIKPKPLALIKEDKRLIPLTYNIFANKEMHNIMLLKEFPKVDPVNCTIKNIVNYMKKNDLFNAIFFSFSKKKCEQYSLQIDLDLVDNNFGIETAHIFDYKIGIYRHMFEKNPRYITLRNLIIKGIAYHHAGLPVILKEIVEILFKEGRIKILFATETFAVGINSPVRSVVFMELEKYDSSIIATRRMISSAEFKQMSGRAGRRGLDTHGYVIIPLFNNNYNCKEIQELINSPPSHLFSETELDYHSYLNLYSNIDKHTEKTMRNNENIIKINHLTDEHSKLSIIISKLDKTILDDFRELENYNKHNLINIKIKLSKEQEKKHKHLNKIAKTYQHEYNIYSRLRKVENEINYINDYNSNLLKQLNYFLTKHGYLDNNNLTLKGICITYINECNPFILVELFLNNHFINKTPIEIIQLLSIFCDENNLEEDNIKSDNLQHSISYVQNLIKQFIQTEVELRRENDDYWKITLSYIKLSYEWASGKPTGYIINLLDEINEYEGNFIKNMIKITNIANTLKILCNITNRLELIDKLDNIDILIKRDIVNNGSLYIT